MLKMIKDIENRTDIDDLMQRFYARAISDDKIGYIFTEVAQLNLEHHLPIIGDFWETLLFGTGDYQKHRHNPMMIHANLSAKSSLNFEHFERWLEIFREEVDKAFIGENADLIKFRANAIANRMLMFVSGKE